MGARVMAGSMFRGGNSPRCKGPSPINPKLLCLHTVHKYTNTQIHNTKQNIELNHPSRGDYILHCIIFALDLNEGEKYHTNTDTNTFDGAVWIRSIAVTIALRECSEECDPSAVV